MAGTQQKKGWLGVLQSGTSCRLWEKYLWVSLYILYVSHAPAAHVCGHVGQQAQAPPAAQLCHFICCLLLVLTTPVSSLPAAHANMSEPSLSTPDDLRVWLHRYNKLAEEENDKGADCNGGQVALRQEQVENLVAECDSQRSGEVQLLGNMWMMHLVLVHNGLSHHVSGCSRGIHLQRPQAYWCPRV